MQASRCFVVLICAPSAAAAKLCPGRQSENASLPPLRKLLKKRGAPRYAYDLMPMNSVIHANPANSANLRMLLNLEHSSSIPLSSRLSHGPEGPGRSNQSVRARAFVGEPQFVNRKDITKGRNHEPLYYVLRRHVEDRGPTPGGVSWRNLPPGEFP